MPHRIAGRKLSRTHDHRVAMLGNLAVSVIRYEKVRTTEAKAKEVRGVVDGMITLAKRGDLHARRQLVSKMPHEPLIVEKLMGEIAEKYADRSSGFTRIIKLGQRPGDAASIVQIELVSDGRRNRTPIRRWPRPRSDAPERSSSTTGRPSPARRSSRTLGPCRGSWRRRLTG